MAGLGKVKPNMAHHNRLAQKVDVNSDGPSMKKNGESHYASSRFCFIPS
jgi:hypothetical protein